MTKEWPIIVASFLTIVFTFGIPTMVMPVIYSPIIDEFGWGRAQVTFVATLKFGAGAVFGIFQVTSIVQLFVDHGASPGRCQH